jgi:hypothetical protein
MGTRHETGGKLVNWPTDILQAFSPLRSLGWYAIACYSLMAQGFFPGHYQLQLYSNNVDFSPPKLSSQNADPMFTSCPRPRYLLFVILSWITLRGALK